MSKPDLQLIMVKDGKGGHNLYGCRGEGKGCNRNKHRASKTQCPDCVLADPKETIGHFQKRMARGDA